MEPEIPFATVEALPTDSVSVTDSPPPSPRVPRAIEILVILSLAVLPDIHHAIASLLYIRSTGPIPFHYTASSGLIRSLQVSVPTLYILWRSREPWSEFGLARPRPRLDLFYTLLTLIAAYAVSMAFTWGLYGLLPDLYRTLYNTRVQTGSIYTGPGGPTDYAVLVLMSAANGFAEELVMRGYLIRRLEQVFNSTPFAVVASALLFAAYHIYYGALGTLNVLVMGLVLGTIFARCRRLWPLVAVHTLWDIYGFVRIH